MNGLAHKREANPLGPYFPFHRDETYPRTLCVNFKRLEYRTLQRYCKLHRINVRPDCTQSELAVAAARHFQEAPAVDEEGVMTSFLKRVIVPDRPYRPAIDLALATMGNLSNDRLHIGGRGVTGALVMDNMSNAHGNSDDGSGVVGERNEGRGVAGGGGRDGGRGMHSEHYGYRHPMPAMGSEEKPGREAYSSRGMGGRDGGGGGYEHEMDYGRPAAGMTSQWETDSHGGGEIAPKATKRSGGGGRGRFRGATSSAPAHGAGSAMSERGMPPASGAGGGNGGGGAGEEPKGRKQKAERGGGGGGSGGTGDAVVKAPPGKKRKGGGGWRAKNGEQVAVRDDREEPAAWILARVIKYAPESHQYELKDDDDKEGMGGLTAPRSSVIRLEETTKGVQKSERVLAVFPDTTSFYVGVVHRVPKTAVGEERRIEVKFNDDADDSGRTPARPLPARHVVPLPEGFDEEEEGKAEEEAAGTGDVGAGEEEAEDAMVTEEDDAGEPPYADMIRTALLKLPGRQGNLPMVCACIEEHFHDRLNWKSESSLRRTPAWKSSVRRTLTQHPAFCHAGTPERNVYTLVE